MSASRTKTAEELDYWLALLEMFPNDHSLLQGAAGEDAMNVGDVIDFVRALKRQSGPEEQTESQGLFLRRVMDAVRSHGSFKTNAEILEMIAAASPSATSEEWRDDPNKPPFGDDRDRT